MTAFLSQRQSSKQTATKSAPHICHTFKLNTSLVINQVEHERGAEEKRAQMDEVLWRVKQRRDAAHAVTGWRGERESSWRRKVGVQPGNINI